MIDDFIESVRRWLDQPGNSKARLAREAQIHANTLRGVESAGWNPTAETIRAIDGAIARLKQPA